MIKWYVLNSRSSTHVSLRENDGLLTNDPLNLLKLLEHWHHIEPP